MISKIHPQFRRQFLGLPKVVQKQARRAYVRFKADPSHPSLHFKAISNVPPFWSARVNVQYRVVGRRVSNDEIIWVFIGTHTDYDKLLSQS